MKQFERKNRIQGYDLSHEEVAKLYDDVEFWRSATESSYIEGKYTHMSKPSKSIRKKIGCKISKEQFLELYEEHKKLMRKKHVKSDGRLCRYCEGYEYGNIVFSCGECNDKKNQISIDMCKRVVEIANEME